MKDNWSKSVFVSQLLQKYQMMRDCPGHGGVLPIGNSKLLSGLLPDLGQWGIVVVADERASMMDDVMVEPARERPYERVSGRIIGCCREDVIYPIIKLVAS